MRRAELTSKVNEHVERRERCHFTYELLSSQNNAEKHMSVIWFKSREFKSAVDEVINENARITNIESDIGCLKSDVAEMRSDIARLDNGVHNLGLQFEDMRSEFRAVFDVLLASNQRYDELRDVKPRLKIVEDDVSVMNITLKEHLKDPKAHRKSLPK